MTDDTTRQIERCPTCGAAVRVASSDEGTNYYVPLDDEARRQAAERAWERFAAERHVTPRYLVGIKHGFEQGYLAACAAERTRLLAELERLAVHWIASSSHRLPRQPATYIELAGACETIRGLIAEGYRCTDPTHTRCREMAERSETP